MIVDLSRSGARIRAGVDDAIAVGSLVDIRIDRGRGVVEVRRIELSHEPTVAYYGVQFVELDDRLKQLILELTRTNPTHPESTPRPARFASRMAAPPTSEEHY